MSLGVGETAPDFRFTDVDGNESSLYAWLESGPVVLNFFRGLWCVYCTSELEAYEEIQAQLAEVNCRYLAVSPQHVTGHPVAGEHEPGYPCLTDHDNQVARKFGIVYRLGDEEVELFSGWGLRLDEVNQCGEWELPVPATFVIAPDRTVAYRFVDVDFRQRCCPEDLLEEVRRLG